MAPPHRHSQHGALKAWQTGRGDTLAVDPRCNGNVRPLYVRLSDPQRWVPVGEICEGCQAIAMLPTRRWGEPRRGAAA